MTTQPDSVRTVGIFSLSTGNMGKGTDLPGGEVNGNYKLDNVSSGGDMYRFKTSSLKAGSHVSFADSDDADNMVKTYSELDISEDQALSGLRLGRSISWSAIERTNVGHSGSQENVFYSQNAGHFKSDSHSIGSMDRLSTSPIQEEVFESVEKCEPVESKLESCDENEQQGKLTGELNDKVSQEKSSHVVSPHRSPQTGKLPNGKSKRPAAGKQTSWLLRLFESKMFDMSIAISYLFNSKEPGVQTYLGK